MHLLSESLTDTEDKILHNWEATPAVIIFALGWVRNWYGTHIWAINIERSRPNAPSVAGKSIFIVFTEATREFYLASE